MTLANLFPTKTAWKRMLFGAFFGNTVEQLQELENRSIFTAYVETFWGLIAFAGFIALLCNLTKLFFC